MGDLTGTMAVYRWSPKVGTRSKDSMDYVAQVGTKNLRATRFKDPNSAHLGALERLLPGGPESHPRWILSDDVNGDTPPASKAKHLTWCMERVVPTAVV